MNLEIINYELIILQLKKNFFHTIPDLVRIMNPLYENFPKFFRQLNDL